MYKIYSEVRRVKHFIYLKMIVFDLTKISTTMYCNRLDSSGYEFERGLTPVNIAGNGRCEKSHF